MAPPPPWMDINMYSEETIKKRRGLAHPTGPSSASHYLPSISPLLFPSPQMDINMYSEETIKKRRGLRTMPEIAVAIDRWWQVRPSFCRRFLHASSLHHAHNLIYAAWDSAFRFFM